MKRMQAKTLYEKLFESHIVREEDGTYLIYIDRHLVHEVTSPQAFEGLRINRRSVWRNKSIPRALRPSWSRCKWVYR